MKVKEADALRAAEAAASMADTTATMKFATTVANMIDTVSEGGPLTPYGQAYRQALKDVFDTLNPQNPNPTPPPEIWAR